MTNLLRSYLGFDKEPESKSDPRLEKISKFVRPKKRYVPKEVEDGGN